MLFLRAKAATAFSVS